jgi:FAD/FMN-containing dehydrogenase
LARQSRTAALSSRSAPEGQLVETVIDTSLLDRHDLGALGMITPKPRNPVEQVALGRVAQGLEEGFRGRIVRPSDADYDIVRAVWNGAIDRRPAVIARCAGPADVIRAIAAARDNELPVAVRCGGHSLAGFSTCDNGMVVDLTPMQGVWVDPWRRRAVAQGGVTWGGFDRETQAFGMATTGGVVSTTGIAGFTLGGGVGYLTRKFGLACDNLIAANVISADGRLVRAAADEVHGDPELLWALRGGGGNFGVVTSLEYQLHAVGPAVSSGAVFYSASEAGDVLRRWREFGPAAPEELATLAVLATGPDFEDLPEAIRHREVIGIVAMDIRPPRESEADLDALQRFGKPLGNRLARRSYVETQSMPDRVFVPGVATYSTSAFLDQLTDRAIDVLIEQWVSAPSRYCEIHIHLADGAAGRIDPDASAFSQRRSPWIVNILARHPQRRDFDGHSAWARQTAADLAGEATGREYVNFASQPSARAAYPRKTWDRLAAVKNRYDPTNVFRLNHNVPPRGGSTTDR